MMATNASCANSDRRLGRPDRLCKRLHKLLSVLAVPDSHAKSTNAATQDASMKLVVFCPRVSRRGPRTACNDTYDDTCLN